MLSPANAFTRGECLVSELMVTLQCGGSAVWSGTTTNSALGYACDRLVAQGGADVLAETPEIYRAENLFVGAHLALKSDAQGPADYESVPWQIGAVM